MILDALVNDVKYTVDEINGLFELTLQYPVTGIHFSDITQRAVILAKADPVSALQPFRVYKITKTSPGIVTVYARHLVYDLAGVPVAPFTASTAPLALEGLKSNAVVACPFTFSTDKTTEGNFAVAAPLAVWSLFGGRTGSILWCAWAIIPAIGSGWKPPTAG